MQLSERDLVQNAIVSTHTVTVEPAGATVASNAVGAAVTLPQGAVLTSTPVSIHVAQRQFASVLRDHYAFSPHGVVLSVAPADLHPDASLTVQLPFQGDYDPVNTMLAVKNAAGKVLALPSEVTSDGKSLVGTISPDALKQLTDKSDPTPADLMAFTANRIDSSLPPVLISGVFQWNGAAFAQPVGDLTGKRVALCVHGINSSLLNLVDLAGFLAGFTLPGQNEPYYQAVVGFQYTSNVPLAQIGTAMAQQLHPVLTPASGVDLFAHSMGNLVSRYALETEGMPSRLGPLVGHYVSLAGPQNGIPFGSLALLQTLVFLFPIECLPCLKDLLTVGANGVPETPFLKALNPASNGPDYTKAHYYSFSGSNFETYDQPVGDTVKGLYVLADPLAPSTWVEDGLVGVYTAQSQVLSRQSASWQPGPTLALNHGQFVTDVSAFQAIGSLIAGW